MAVVASCHFNTNFHHFTRQLLDELIRCGILNIFFLFFLFKCLKWEKGNLCCSEFREEKNVENENYSGSTWANRSQCKEINARLWSKFNFESDRAVRRFRGLSDLQWILELNFVTLNNPKNKRQNWLIRKFWTSTFPQPCTHLHWNEHYKQAKSLWAKIVKLLP